MFGNTNQSSSTGGTWPSLFSTTTSTAGASTGTNLFGQQTTNLFGQTIQPQQPSLFGGTSTTFSGQSGLGAAQPSLFGGSTAFSGQSGLGAGQTSVAPAFGFGSQPTSTPSLFGQQQQPSTTTTGLFGRSGFSTQTTQVGGGTSIKFTPIIGTETANQNGISTQINTKNQCITAMREYESQSFEELRFQDYQLNRKGPSSIFSTPAQPQATGLFSGIGTTTSTGTGSLFGQSGTTGNMFGSQQRPGGLFGSSTPSTTTFGTGLNFSTPATQQPQTSIFGTTNTATPSTPFSFSTPQPTQPQAQSSIFGQTTPATSTSSTSTTFGTGLFSSTPANTANKSIFGTPTATSTFGTPTATSTFGTGSLFSTNTPTQQNRPFTFSTPFGSQAPAQPASQPIANSTPAFGFSNPVGTSTTGFGSQPVAPAPAFGFGTPGQTGMPFGSNTQSTPSAPFLGFGSSFQNNNAAAIAPVASAPSLFYNAGNAQAFGGFVPPPQPMYLQQHLHQPVGSSFALSPFKDSHLFYNMISNRKVEDFVRPTPSKAELTPRQTGRRRPTTAMNCLAELKSLRSNANHNSTRNKSESTPSKARLFDGFTEEDLGVHVHLFKKSVKQLVLQDCDINERSGRRRPSVIGRHHDGEDVTGKGIVPASLYEVTDPADKDSPRSEPAQSPRFLEIEPGSFTTASACGAGDSSCGVVCTRKGYYIKPGINELDKLVNPNSGACVVSGFEVGRTNFGKIRFLGPVNVANVNIDALVMFRQKEVVVYPDDENKPEVGQGLNCPAEIELEGVFPNNMSAASMLNYEQKLRKACQRLEAEFISYNDETGVWKLRVAHFSKYNCDVEDEEEEGFSEDTLPQSM